MYNEMFRRRGPGLKMYGLRGINNIFVPSGRDRRVVVVVVRVIVIVKVTVTVIVIVI